MNFYLGRRAGIILILMILVGFIFLRNQATAPVEVSSTPTPSTPIRGEANIVVTSPKAGDVVSNPIIVTGRARVFENTVNYRLRQAGVPVNVSEIFAGFTTAHAPDIGLFGNFSLKIPILPTLDAKAVGQIVIDPTPGSLIIEVFNYSAKDGSIENLVQIPVTLASTKTTKVKAFFTNHNLQKKIDPNLLRCDLVFPVEREVAETKEPALLSLYELLMQPTSEEGIQKGYGTALPDFRPFPEGIIINSLRISSGTAYVDFNEALQEGVAGSCRVSAIRAQITETLKQFSSVKNVVISIEGRIDDILQP